MAVGALLRPFGSLPPLLPTVLSGHVLFHALVGERQSESDLLQPGPFFEGVGDAQTFDGVIPCFHSSILFVLTHSPAY